MGCGAYIPLISKPQIFLEMLTITILMNANDRYSKPMKKDVQKASETEIRHWNSSDAPHPFLKKPLRNTVIRYEANPYADL